MSFVEVLEFIRVYYLNSCVLIAMAAALLCCLLRRKYYDLALWQVILLYAVHAVFGNVGDRVTARIALGYWGGGCWYGVPLMILLSIWLLTKILKKDYGTIGDMSAAGICVLHILSKVACIFQGCCTGVILFFTDTGKAIHFPCREFEIIANTIVLIVLLRFEKRRIAKGMLWELYMIWYAVIRYIAAWLREIPIDWKPFFLWIPAPRLWTVVICATGIVILFFHFQKIYGRKPTIQEMLRAIIGKLPAREIEEAV